MLTFRQGVTSTYFRPVFLFYSPLKTQENLTSIFPEIIGFLMIAGRIEVRLSDVLRGYKKETLA